MTAALEPEWWLAQWTRAGTPRRLCVAFSGGRDSTALLHSLSRMAKGVSGQGPELRAVHINHGLQEGAASWARHCKAQASDWSVPLRVVEVQVRADGNGLEDAARQARYSALMGQLAADEWLLTAHHQQDQAETLLLNLFRGAGVKGLSAMPEVRERLGGRHWRPMLALPNELIDQYVSTHSLRWLDDPSNEDPRFRRNWLRNVMLPQLRESYPTLDQQLVQTAGQMAEAQRHLDVLADQWLAPRLMEGGCGLSLQAWERYSGEQQRLMLRRWLDQMLPSADQLLRLQRELIEAGPDRQPEFKLGDWTIRRFGCALWRLRTLPPLDSSETARRALAPGETQLPAGAGSLTVQGATALLADLQWGFAVGGERIKLHDQVHHRRLKQLHQRIGVPPWIRVRTPLLWRNQALLSVGGYWNSTEFAELQQQGLVFRWKHALCAEPRKVLRSDKPETA